MAQLHVVRFKLGGFYADTAAVHGFLQHHHEVQSKVQALLQ